MNSKQVIFFKQVTFLFLSAMFLCSCFQQKNLIKQVHAYYTEKVPGIIQVDENGNALPVKIDTVIVVYVETTTKEILWDSAWENNHLFTIVPHLFETNTYDAGFKKGTNEKVIITGDSQNFLYRLYMQPVNNQEITAPGKVEGQELLLRGKYKQKTFLQKSGKMVELDGHPSV